MSIETLKPTHPESSRADYGEYASIQMAVENITCGYPEKSQRTPEQTIGLAENVQHVVRQSLRFDSSSKLSDLEDSQTTTCVGYTAVGSEALQVADVDHYVAFMNGHANMFVPITVEDKRRVWMVDMLCSELNQDITDKFAPYKQEDETGRMYGVLYAARLEIPHNKNISDVDSYPWVAHKKCSDQDIEPQNNRRLIVTLSEPEAGRTDIMQYSSFREACDQQDVDSASEALLALRGRFPDIDIRGESENKVRAIVKKLAARGDYDRAIEVTEAFYDSFKGDDPRLAEYRGDCMRIIAKESGRSELAKLAISLYEKALPPSRKATRECALGKLATSKHLAAQLGP